MSSKTKLLGICLCVSGLSACTTDNSVVYTNTPPYSYGAIPYNYNYGTVANYSEYDYSMPVEKKPVEVPDSYHVNSVHAPTPHKDVDREWVNSQNAQSYTIELADDEKPAQVAGTLYKAPKSQRTAEVKYQRDGKTYYKGLYGTYPSYEAAQEALKNLPEDVKQKAGVKSWSSVQSGVNE